MKGCYLGAFTLLMGIVGVFSDTQRILWGQCYSNCLTEHSEEISQVRDDKPRGEPSLIKNCRRVRDCKTCLFACDRSPENYTSIDACLHDCELEYPNYGSCRKSCRYLATVSKAKIGICPSKESMDGFRVACVDQCRHDADCSTNKKCCDNGCGFTCQRPTNDTSLPKKPVDVRFDTRKDGGVVVSWDLPKGSWKKHAIKPFVFVIRWRNTQGRGHNFHVTDRTYLKLRGIVPASTIHVIVAAVNIHGSRGFTTVKVHTKEFMKPSPPVNFEEGGTTYHDEKVDVEIKWQPPHQTEGLPITRYVVLRSEGLPRSSAMYHRINMKKYRISPNRHKFTFKDLKPGTRYFVQVYATVRWHHKVHKGRMASMYILTYAPPAQNSSTTAPHVRPAPTGSSAIYNITVDQSIYDGGVLKTRIQWKTVTEEVLEKYLVYWRPYHCDSAGRRRFQHFSHAEHSATTHDQTFNLYNLHYSCNYTVHIKPVNNFNDILPGAVTSFATPHCVDIKVQGEIRPSCPIVPQNLPGQPSDIQIHWLIDRCSIDVEIMWQAPLSRQPITGYLIQWGWSQEVPPTSRKVVFNKPPEDLQISGNSTVVILTGLQSTRHYTIRISGVSRGGEGDPAIKHFLSRRPRCTTTSTRVTEPSSTISPEEVEEMKYDPCSKSDGSSPPATCSGSCVLIGWITLFSLILSVLMQ